MSEYDNRGQVSIWKNDKATSDKAPVLRGTVVAHRDIAEGEEVEISLWKNDNVNERAPVLKGKIKDKFAGESENPAPKKSDFDDLPF